MLTDKPLRELLGAFASSDPTPGGGSASALASALGASLLLMVARLPKARSGSEDHRTALAGAAAALLDVQQQLIDAIDADSAAYDQVVAAYRQPRATDHERQARTDAVQRALRLATEVPLRVMRRSVEGLTRAEEIAARGHPGAASDVGVAIALLQAGLEGARLNVRTNLEGIVDRAYVEEARAESDRLAALSKKSPPM